MKGAWHLWIANAQLALLYEAQGKLDLARKTLEETATQSPKLIDVLVDLARVAYKQKDFEGALGYLAHARDLEPANAGVHFFFGMVCIESELVLEARDSLRKAVELEPNETLLQLRPRRRHDSRQRCL